MHSDMLYIMQFVEIKIKRGRQKLMGTSNDQTIKADAGKAKLSLVPPAIIFDIAKLDNLAYSYKGKSINHNGEFPKVERKVG